MERAQWLFFGFCSALSVPTDGQRLIEYHKILNENINISLTPFEPQKLSFLNV